MSKRQGLKCTQNVCFGEILIYYYYYYVILIIEGSIVNHYLYQNFLYNCTIIFIYVKTALNEVFGHSGAAKQATKTLPT